MVDGKQETSDPCPLAQIWCYQDRWARPWVLTTLCYVDACVVVYVEGEESQSEVWLGVPKVAQLLASFKAMSELD